MGGPTPTHRVRRALNVAAAIMGIGLTFVIALAGGLVLHLNLPTARRFATHELNRVLSGQFKGTIALERVSTLHADRAGGVDVRISAADGKTLIVARGMRARIHPIALARSLLRADNLDIGLFDIAVERLDVCLDTDEDGTLELQTAVTPFARSGATSVGRPLRLALQDVTLRHAHVHGQMKGAPPVDADLDGLRGTVRVVPNAVAVDVWHAALAARGMPGGANPSGGIDAHLALPSKTGHRFGLDTAFFGVVGGIPVTASAAIDGERLDGVVDVPEVADSMVRALVPEAPLYRPTGAHVEAHGDLARLRTTARVTSGAAEVRAAGELALAGRFAATVGVDATNVDLRAFSPAAPASRLALHADVRIDARPNGTLAGRFTLATPDGEIDNQSVPAATFQGAFEQTVSSDGGREGVEVKVQGLVSEPGAPVDIRMDLRTDRPVPAIAFYASSSIRQLSAVRRLGNLGPGSASLRVEGTATLTATPSFDATLAASVVGFQRAAARVEHGRLEGHAFGPFTDPVLQATLDADGLTAARYQFRHAHVRTNGPLSAQTVSLSLRGAGGPNLRARATLGLGGALAVEDAQLDLSRGLRALHATVKHVRFEPAGVSLVGAQITGIGEPIGASLDTHRGSLLVRGSSKGVDLQALGYLLGIEDKLRAGRLSFVVDLAARPDGAEGSATIDLERGSFVDLQGVGGHIDTRMQGREVTGQMNASVADVGTLEINRMHVKVGGKGPLDSGWWRKSWGALRVDGQVDLAKAAGLLPPNTLPFSELAGRLSLQGYVERDSESDVTPDVALTLKTSGLGLAPRSGPDEQSGATTLLAKPPWNLSGVDLQLDVRVDGDSGFAEFATRAIDRDGALVSLDAKSAALPFGRLLGSRDGAAELLKDVPFSALILVPSRKLDRLPDVLKPDGASGEAEARISIEGPWRTPTIEAQAQALSFKFDRSPISRRLDAEVTAHYEGSAADIRLDARSHGSEVLHASAHVNAAAEEVLAGRAGTFPWDATAKATFTRFPLGAIAALSNRQVRGEMSGDVEVDDLHRDGRASVDLDLAKLTVGADTFDAGHVKISCDGHLLEAGAHLERNDALADVNAKTAVSWGTSPTPSVDPSGAAEASVQAKHFPAAVLAPFSQGVLDELQGTIDADAHISRTANEKPRMTGAVTFSDGLVELTTLGQELHGVNAKVLLSPDGVVRLENLSASGTTGRLTASGTGRVDGLNMVGAEALVKINKGEAMPLELQGVPMGTVYGQLDIKAASSSDQKAFGLSVDVPSLHVELPEASSHSVQELDESAPETHAGVYVAPGKFVLLPLDGLDAQEQTEGPPKTSNPVVVGIHLGRDVEVRRGTDLKVDMEGDLTAKTGEKTEITGQIRLTSGKLDVQGKAFEIETGTVTFLGDPSNPEVKATATWTADDGTRVYADYVGPLKTGKVVLHSDPARPQNEILALILFGTANGSQATPYASPQPDATTQAGTTVGGFATSGLSKGLDKLTGMEITTKIDTSQGNPRPEVAVQIARDISLQIAFVLGTPPPGTNPDTTYATIDWRFDKNWSLETTFGNLGSSIADIVWQRRY